MLNLFATNKHYSSAAITTRFNPAQYLRTRKSLLLVGFIAAFAAVIFSLGNLSRSGHWERMQPPKTEAPIVTPVLPVLPTESETTRRFPGDPNPRVFKKAYWGAGIAGNGDPMRHEFPTDSSLSVRRTFWQWDNATEMNSGMYRAISSDLQNNRLPFVSVKTPGWTAVANGKHDDELDSILKKLDSYGKPIWFVVHHEPEGGGGRNSPDDTGGAADWRKMQTHVRERMTALKTKNIAFMPVLMSWTWNPASGRDPEDWWVDGIWDAYIIDHYRDSETGDMFTEKQWNAFVAWIEKKGLPYGTAEWGNRGSNAAAAQEMQAFWDWAFTNDKDVIVHTYFDSSLNSATGSWELTGQPLTKFQNILKTDPRVQRIDDL